MKENQLNTKISETINCNNYIVCDSLKTTLVGFDECLETHKSWFFTCVLHDVPVTP